MEVSDKKNMTRHKLRDKVFGLVFRIEFYPENELDEQIESFEEFGQEEGYLPEDLEYITSKFRAVKEKLPEIRRLIIPFVCNITVFVNYSSKFPV